MTPKKYPQNLLTPKNIHFSENRKNNEIQNFEPPKNDSSLRVCENIRVPPPPPPPPRPPVLIYYTSQILALEYAIVKIKRICHRAYFFRISY